MPILCWVPHINIYKCMSKNAYKPYENVFGTEILKFDIWRIFGINSAVNVLIAFLDLNKHIWHNS